MFDKAHSIELLQSSSIYRFGCGVFATPTHTHTDTDTHRHTDTYTHTAIALGQELHVITN